ncbi:hypothetical protein M3Y94_00924700 [Aphelenchoides besseyi]|nr:hypothetical protein M3Y94_00924700 [Aphelenchoides besseyi]
MIVNFEAFHALVHFLFLTTSLIIHSCNSEACRHRSETAELWASRIVIIVGALFMIGKSALELIRDKKQAKGSEVFLHARFAVVFNLVLVILLYFGSFNFDLRIHTSDLKESNTNDKNSCCCFPCHSSLMHAFCDLILSCTEFAVAWMIDVFKVLEFLDPLVTIVSSLVVI